jgi:KaiC/GvpD/RAD55 family RecA-like ATPase
MIKFFKRSEEPKEEVPTQKEKADLKAIEELVKTSEPSIPSAIDIPEKRMELSPEPTSIQPSQEILQSKEQPVQSTEEILKPSSSQTPQQSLEVQAPKPAVKIPVKIPRIATGIPGLDNLLEGGFIPNSTILISGEAGSGKTIFCTQFLWNALCMGENGVYVTVQESPEDIKNDIMSFGRDFNDAIKRNQLRIIYKEPHKLEDLVKDIIKNVKQINAKRVVIDSVTLIGEEVKNVRRSLIYLVRILKSLGVTTLLISEIEEETKKLSKFGVEEFIVDGVIVLQYLEYAAGGATRSLLIKKMRRTNHGKDIYPFEITKKGIVVRET